MDETTANSNTDEGGALVGVPLKWKKKEKLIQLENSMIPKVRRYDQLYNYMYYE